MKIDTYKCDACGIVKGSIMEASGATNAQHLCHRDGVSGCPKKIIHPAFAEIRLALFRKDAVTADVVA